MMKTAAAIKPTRGLKERSSFEAALRRRRPSARKGTATQNQKKHHAKGEYPFRDVHGPGRPGSREKEGAAGPETRTGTYDADPLCPHISSAAILSRALTMATATGVPPFLLRFVMKGNSWPESRAFDSRAFTNPTGTPTTSGGQAGGSALKVSMTFKSAVGALPMAMMPMLWLAFEGLLYPHLRPGLPLRRMPVRRTGYAAEHGPAPPGKEPLIDPCSDHLHVGEDVPSRP